MRETIQTVSSALRRIFAISSKEWRLNLRFPLEYLFNNVILTLKTALPMYLVYRGMLPHSPRLVGVLDSNNYLLFLLTGLACHSLFVTSLFSMRLKIKLEREWMCMAGTFLSPASPAEIVTGNMIGSLGLHIMISGSILTIAVFIFHLSFITWLLSVLAMCLLCLTGIGFGLVGAAMGLAFQGRSFVFDYAVNGIVFLSCFYYPVQIFPARLHSTIRLLPTYRAVELIERLFLGGSPSYLPSFGYLLAAVAILIPLATHLFSRSLKSCDWMTY